MADTIVSPNNRAVVYRGRPKRERSMPVVSKAQNAAMHAAAAGKSTLGIPQKVGAEFTADQAPGSVKALPIRVKRRQTGGPVTPLSAEDRAYLQSAQRRQDDAQSGERMQQYGEQLRGPWKSEAPRSSPSIAPDGTVKGFRRGGPIKGDGTYLVGEEGPELFVPKHKGAIVPNKEVRRLGDKYGNRSSSKLARLRKSGLISDKQYARHLGGKDQEPIDGSSR